ncbi:MAG: ABC transporter ATP-binding protein [Lachnospira sp.]|nr:ABC transporter ATP-binding protein [Lachnospira sp.]
MVLINDIVKDYGDFHLNVSLELPDGRVSGLVGKNGSGKSTTIKLILGLVKPDAGSIEVFGKTSGQLSAQDKQNIGVALSNSGFNSNLNVKDVICILRKMYSEFDEDYFRQGCSRMRVPLDKQIKSFSTGMKAKLRVLVAISHKAKLLIMDEPTAGLDVEARTNILDMLRDYLSEDEERSVIITSHISTDLEGICDDIYLIHDGTIILHEDTDRILDNYAVLKVDEKMYNKLDKSHILSEKKEKFGYICFTDERQYYSENYPGIVIENGSIDDLIIMMTGGRE